MSAEELPSLLQTTMVGLNDSQQTSTNGTCVMLNGFIKQRGEELAPHVATVVSGMMKRGGEGAEGSGENKPREKDRERGDSDITNRTPYSHGGHYIRGYNEWQPARPAQPCHSSYVARCRSPFSISYASHNVRLCSLRSLSLLRFFVPCFLISSYFINPSFPCRHVIKSLQVIAKDKNLILPLVNHLTDIINNKLPYDEKVDKNKKIRTPEFPPMAVCYKSFSSLPSHPLSSFLISIPDFKLTIL